MQVDVNFCLTLADEQTCVLAHRAGVVAEVFPSTGVLHGYMTLGTFGKFYVPNHSGVAKGGGCKERRWPGRRTQGAPADRGKEFWGKVT